LEKNALLDVSFLTNFASDSGDSFSIMVNGVTKVDLRKFKPGATLDRLSDIVLPEGDVEVQFVVYWNRAAHPNDKVVRRFGFRTINVHYIDEIIDPGDPESGDPSLIARSLSSAFNPTRREKVSLPVGTFIPMETIRLDNVKEVEIDDKFEMEAAEARIILSNPKGFYSPTYDPGQFPELKGKTPFSYIANGFHINVLSENTPIRIYMGYGPHTIRMFTGLVDKVDSNSEEETITINCRNMYKRLIEKVIPEDLEYGYSSSDAVIAAVASALNDGTDVDSLPRLKKIIYYAQKWAKHFEVDPIVILAVARKETALGTTGAGREESGDYICGFGVLGPNKKLEKYKGIEAQCKAVAERMKKVCGTGQVDREYIYRLWLSYKNGDNTWTPQVWQFYQEMKGDTQFTEAVFKADAVPPPNQTPKQEKSRDEIEASSSYWLKSAILQDLIRVGGLVGWRSQYEDRLYPDSIIEETYYIDVKPEKRMVVKANPAENGEYTFSEVPLSNIKTIDGWKNGLYQLPITFAAFKHKVNECIREITKDTNYRTWCDRYGTFRAEPVEYDSPVVERFSDTENLCIVNSSIDYSRARSHVIVVGDDEEGKARHCIDPELLLELKGEIRSAVVEVPWAKTDEQKDEVARRIFWDMKRMCRTLQVSVPAHPHLDVLDCIHISDLRTCTRGEFTIKGIHTVFKESGEFMQTLDLTWMETSEMITNKSVHMISTEPKQA
jgi:hypothetical protein